MLAGWLLKGKEITKLLFYSVALNPCAETDEVHFQCLKAELCVLSSMLPHPHFLNLIGSTVNYRRPSFLISGVSQSDPAGLLFEYPWYGRLFAFLSSKRRAIVTGNSRASWTNLEQGAFSAEGKQLHPHLLHPDPLDYFVTASDAGRPFFKPLSDPLDEVDLVVFALQIALAMQHLATKKARYPVCELVGMHPCVFVIDGVWCVYVQRYVESVKVCMRIDDVRMRMLCVCMCVYCVCLCICVYCVCLCICVCIVCVCAYVCACVCV